jgi:NOL1/NOP2/fmu family ribosome biogenesis protein
MNIMNSKEKKELHKLVESQFGISFDKEKVFLSTNKEKVYMLNRDLERIDFESLRIDHMGLYVGKFQIDGFRPSIEGSQLLKGATKNVLDLKIEQKHAWMRGEDLDVFGDERIVLVKSGEDFLGAGKVSKNRLLTGVPKARRLKVVNEDS